MDPSKNPYAPGAGVAPLYLAGRGEIIREFDITLRRLRTGLWSAAPLITGPRGSGKTVLLNRLVQNAQDAGWFIASEEVVPSLPLPKLMATLVRDVLLHMSTKRRIQNRVNRALGVLKAFTSVSAFGVELNIDAKRATGSADTGILEVDLRRLFVEIGEVAKLHSSGVLLAFDEMHVLTEKEFSAVFSALHQTGQRALPVAIAGAGLFPSWQSGPDKDSPLRISTYPARMATSSYKRLDPLSWAASEHVLVRAAVGYGVHYTPDALRRTIGFCEGSPWVLQMAGSEAWNLAYSSPINGDAVEQACKRVDAQLAQWYFPRLLRSCSDEQLELLRKIAESNDWNPELRNLNLGDLEDVIASRPIRRSLTSLAALDLIDFPNAGRVPRRGLTVRFSMPRLREYLRRTYALG